MEIEARCPWCKEGIGAWEMSPEMAIVKAIAEGIEENENILPSKR
uniref:Uncharacterized protein n=1 Tax=viral metagenome TaxID=1070528 RepID=A0A6M3KH78_9ZZZZ